MKILKTLFYVSIILIFATLVSYLVNSTTIQLLNNSTLVLSTENINQVKAGDIVQLEGTINSFQVLTDSTKDSELATYFVGLKEYPNQLIVKIKKNKLSFDKQLFKGKVESLSTNLGSQIIDTLNEKVNLNSDPNLEISQQFNSEEKDQIGIQSTAQFSSDSLIILDEVLTDRDSIYLNIFITFIAISIFLITLLRKKIITVN